VSPATGRPLQLFRALPQLILISAAITFGTGCRHQQQAVAVAPPPALPTTPIPGSAPTATSTPSSSGLPGAIADSTADADFVGSHPAIYSEEGMASWYGQP
jgi:hypothetical protein